MDTKGLEILRNEINCLEQCFLNITKHKPSCISHAESFKKIDIEQQENIEEVRSIKNKLCENFDQLKDVYDKPLDTFSKYIDEVKVVINELENSYVIFIDETSKYLESKVVTLKSLEEVFSVFLVIYSEICENLVKLESLLQKENENLKISVKTLLALFKDCGDVYKSYEKERDIRNKNIEEQIQKQISFNVNQINELENENVKLFPQIGKDYIDKSVIVPQSRDCGQERKRQEEMSPSDRKIFQLELKVDKNTSEIIRLRRENYFLQRKFVLE